MSRIKCEIARIWLWTGLVMTGYALEMFKTLLTKEET